MVNRKMRRLVLTLGMSLAIVSLTAGCSQLKKPQETETQTQSETQTKKETETESETQSETETETETELKTDIAYTSQDKSVQITLPDSTWKVTQDADEMRVFSSGSAAMINIVHAADDTQMKNISVYESEETLTESLTKQYTGSDAFEVQSFETAATDTLKTYEYVVKYNSTSMWSYSITYAILADHEAYIIQGTVTDDNKVLLEAVKKSVESFKVLGDSVFNLKQTGTVQNQSETTQTESEENTDEELSTLQDYGTTATLYASDNVNVRLDPSTDSDDNIMGSLEKGDSVTVIGETSKWFKVNIGGNIGYISKEFLVSQPVQETDSSETTAQTDSEKTEETQSTEASIDSSKVDAEKNSEIDYDSSSMLYTTTEVNVRQQPGTDSDLVDVVGSGQPVTVIGETDNWYVVSVNGVTGYISKSYISSSQPQTDSGNDSNTDDTGNTDNSGNTDNTGNTDNSGNTDNTDNTDNSGNTDSSETISGTIKSVSGDSVVIAGDDGNTYTVNTADASIDTSNGIYEGLYVSANVDVAPDGSLIASDVTGH